DRMAAHVDAVRAGLLAERFAQEAEDRVGSFEAVLPAVVDGRVRREVAAQLVPETHVEAAEVRVLQLLDGFEILEGLDACLERVALCHGMQASSRVRRARP